MKVFPRSVGEWIHDRQKLGQIEDGHWWINSSLFLFCEAQSGGIASMSAQRLFYEIEK